MEHVVTLNDNQIENLANGMSISVDIVSGIKDGKPQIDKVILQQSLFKPMMKNFINNNIKMVNTKSNYV